MCQVIKGDWWNEFCVKYIWVNVYSSFLSRADSPFCLLFFRLLLLGGMEREWNQEETNRSHDSIARLPTAELLVLWDAYDHSSCEQASSFLVGYIFGIGRKWESWVSRARLHLSSQTAHCSRILFTLYPHGWLSVHGKHMTVIPGGLASQELRPQSCSHQ